MNHFNLAAGAPEIILRFGIAAGNIEDARSGKEIDMAEGELKPLVMRFFDAVVLAPVDARDRIPMMLDLGVGPRVWLPVPGRTDAAVFGLNGTIGEHWTRGP